LRISTRPFTRPPKAGGTSRALLFA